MIIDNLEKHHLYEEIHEGLSKAFKFLKETDLKKMEPGRYEIDGEKIFASVEAYDTKPKSQGRWEGHRRYLDIQYIVSGVERMGCTDTEGMKVIDEYDQKKDILFFEGDGNFFDLKEGSFAIFMPQDIHMPGLSKERPLPVKKVVVKVMF